MSNKNSASTYIRSCLENNQIEQRRSVPSFMYFFLFVRECSFILYMHWSTFSNVTILYMFKCYFKIMGTGDLSSLVRSFPLFLDNLFLQEDHVHPTSHPHAHWPVTWFHTAFGTCIQAILSVHPSTTFLRTEITLKNNPCIHHFNEWLACKKKVSLCLIV